MAIAHEFAWSVSRHGNFRECRRRFYFDYYHSWRGWEAHGDPARRRTYLLKKMTRLPMYAGDVLHRALERWFQGRAAGRAPGYEELCAWAVDELRQGWRQSRDKAADWRRRPTGLVRLAEHHYEEPEVDESGPAAADYGGRFKARIEEGLRFFYEAPELAEVRDSLPADWLPCEELGTIELFRSKVYAIPDFALRTPSGIAIYDWKSGSPREADRFQLALYALYAEQVWQVEPTSVRCIDVYLPKGELHQQSFGDDELETVLGQVHSSITDMRATHFDADAELRPADEFPQLPADDPAAQRTCARCNYRELCERV